MSEPKQEDERKTEHSGKIQDLFKVSYFPSWMGEVERAALILGVSIVAAAAVLGCFIVFAVKG